MAWRLFGKSKTKEIAINSLICGEGKIGVRTYYDNYFMGIKTGSGFKDNCIGDITPLNPKTGNRFIRFTKPNNSDWKKVNGDTEETSGLSIILDYKDCKFSNIPFIVPQLRGDIDIWAMQVSISYVSNTSAIVYIRSTIKGYTPSIDEAIKKNWHIVYSAEDNDWLKDYKYPPHEVKYEDLIPCDNA